MGCCIFSLTYFQVSTPVSEPHANAGPAPRPGHPAHGALGVGLPVDSAGPHQLAPSRTCSWALKLKFGPWNLPIRHVGFRRCARDVIHLNRRWLKFADNRGVKCYPALTPLVISEMTAIALMRFGVILNS